ncbi:hypothetical protein EYS09_04100 [Streptomyces kasugaensis]|uniref:Uncharacterized protein n=1 Tax=Streptomyces kasugaensis TaxID=1946 RepID=A0A4Q9HZS2_STRKA|nr:hypothetical protein [Streptomyces kasugaensis]TBO60888.1 hypothetical protein EYS09_04100 [Streptomyces kasugaensis]
MSRILTDQGHYRRALTLADGALHLGATKAHPAVRSWLHAVRAHHHACLGNARSAQSDLCAAWNLGRATPWSASAPTPRLSSARARRLSTKPAPSGPAGNRPSSAFTTAIPGRQRSMTIGPLPPVGLPRGAPYGRAEEAHPRRGAVLCLQQHG